MYAVPAKELLHIYRVRLCCAEEGIIHPAAEVVAGMRALVAGLTALPNDEPVGLERLPECNRFLVAETGRFLAEIPKAFGTASRRTA